MREKVLTAKSLPISLVSELMQEKYAQIDESPKSKIVLEVGNSTDTMQI